MDEREERILRTYEEFKDFGVIDDEGDEPIDATTAEEILREKVTEFEQNIEVAYENKGARTTRLTKAALLGLMIEGGTDEEIQTFIHESGLSPRHPVQYRREEAIKAIKTVEAVAEKVRTATDSRSELLVREDEYRSVDDTLVRILERGGLTPAQQGSMRLLFGLASVERTDRRTVDVVAHMKANAAGLLRVKLEQFKEELSQTNRAHEGERVLYLLVNRTKLGYPTLQSVAETIAYDKEVRSKAAYSDNIERNQQMIETYVSYALDVMYPDVEDQA